MNKKQNCWEYMKCGREVGGALVDELGTCPAATTIEADGFAGGKNAGRACCYVTGTFCGGAVQGTYKDKERHCEACSFYKKLRSEHGAGMSVLSFGAFVRDRRKQ